MGMDFEQALKVHQGIWAWQGIAIVQGHFFPVYGKALHGVDGRAHVKGKGYLGAGSIPRIEFSTTLSWLLSITRLVLDSLYKVDTSA